MGSIGSEGFPSSKPSSDGLSRRPNDVIGLIRPITILLLRPFGLQHEQTSKYRVFKSGFEIMIYK
jgi:hypothetical protein